MIYSTIFSSKELALKFKPSRPTYVISITDPISKIAHFKNNMFVNIIRLSFDDATENSVGFTENDIPDLLPGHEDGRRILINGNELCDHNDAKKIINLVEKCHQEDISVDILVHCEMGISRSAAVAEFISSNFGGKIVSLNGNSTKGKNNRLYRLLNNTLNSKKPSIHENPYFILNMKRQRISNI